MVKNYDSLLQDNNVSTNVPPLASVDELEKLRVEDTPNSGLTNDTPSPMISSGIDDEKMTDEDMLKVILAA